MATLASAVLDLLQARGKVCRYLGLSRVHYSREAANLVLVQWNRLLTDLGPGFGEARGLVIRMGSLFLWLFLRLIR